MRHARGTLTKVRIAGPTLPVPAIAVTLSPRRHGTVAWSTGGLGIGSSNRPLTVSQSDVDSRGTIGKRHQLDIARPTGRGDSGPQLGVRLRALLGADGVATYAWTGYVDGHCVVRAERLHREIGTVEQLSPPSVDARLMDLSGDAAGSAIAVWSTRGGAQAPAVMVAIRPAGSATFGAPEVVLTGADATGTAAGAIAPGGHAVVAGAPAPVLNASNPPGVRVTQRIGL